MANILSREKQITCIGALAEGSSIRSIERLTGVHGDTISRLAVRVGKACAVIMDEKMRNLTCEKIQMDEIWGFIGKKQANLRPGDVARGLGDIWTWVWHPSGVLTRGAGYRGCRPLGRARRPGYGSLNPPGSGIPEIAPWGGTGA